MREVAEEWGAEIIFSRPNPFVATGRLWSEMPRRAMERAMKRTLIRYKTRPDAADQNAGLIQKVFEELKAAKPEGVRYLSLRLDDNTFVHLVEAEEGSIPLPSLDAFKAFQSGIRERCVEPPVPSGVTIVGNYRMLSEN
jgi:radical SAM superfamily enzyme with C-terminal helix-hairpin-helix motif